MRGDEVAQAVQVEGRTRRGALWTRDFALYFVGRAISILGDAMLPVAVSLGVLGAGYGATGVGYVLAAWMAPFGGLILFGGVFADRFTARRMMIGADLVRVVTQSVIAAAFLTGTPALPLLIVLSALSGAAAAMFQPGVSSMVPQISQDVQRANATLRVADAMAQLLGPALSGSLILLGGAGVVYGVNAGTFAVSAVCLLALRVRPVATLARGSSFLRNLREGWDEFRSRTWMWGVIIVWSVYGVLVFGPLMPLGVAVVSETLGKAAVGWIMSAAGAGTIVGGVLAMWVKPARPLAAGAVGMILYFLEPLVIALHLPGPVVAASFSVSGAAWAFWSVMWATSVQTQVTQDVLNRVTAYEVAGSVLSIPIGQALSGPVAARVGAEHVLMFGFVVGLIGVVCLLSVPAIRNLRRV
ncbi:MFS transporter [Planotetraspora sp. A-T 1434]|uniref:MFS transporter n=1 Tax=Planotetraspora sp. A-T 1434 TaxID=2979219 RepID=UPI0021C01633|nr:MFS transporter [Planotetraspora sp. A-T 1434]MCT9932089.1 MFS transporter [Planotetraspora sp. A-T 1434]